MMEKYLKNYDNIYFLASKLIQCAFPWLEKLIPISPPSFGHKELSVSKMIPSVLELASDSSAPVRDQAIETLCDIYRLVGEPIRNDILRRRSLPFQK